MDFDNTTMIRGVDARCRIVGLAVRPYIFYGKGIRGLKAVFDMPLVAPLHATFLLAICCFDDERRSSLVLARWCVRREHSNTPGRRA